MSVLSQAPPSPDLSSLTRRQRLNVAVAQTQGATWERWRDSWALVVPAEDGEGFLIAVRMWDDGETDFKGSPDFRVLPDYAGDPAAWGALMEKKGVWVEPVRFNDDLTVEIWRGYYRTRIDVERTPFAELQPETATVSSAGEAVCAAVLQKHGIDPTPYIGE